MKVVQSVSGDKSFVDFAVTKDEKIADIYSVSSSTLTRDDFKEKLDKYVTLTESNVPWDKIKTEKGKQKVEIELFQLISAFLSGSTRGRSDSTFDNGEPDPKRQRMEIMLSIDTRLTNEDDYNDLAKQIHENEQNRRDQLDEYIKGWESMTPEEFEARTRRYEESLKQEEEQAFMDDPDYEPESDSDSSRSGSSDSTTDDDDDETLTDSEPEN